MAGWVVESLLLLDDKCDNKYNRNQRLWKKGNGRNLSKWAFV